VQLEDIRGHKEPLRQLAKPESAPCLVEAEAALAQQESLAQ
jgi:hypothetical protein